MERNLYKKTKNFVIDSFTKVSNERGIKHFLRTVYWIKKLKPDADEAMLIAAVAHDIERAYRDREKIKAVFKARGLADFNFLEYHQKKGVQITEDFLREQKADEELIERVKTLIREHESGGNEDQNILRDADSVSFFENNAIHLIDDRAEEYGKAHVREKLEWMFNRITSRKAKEISKPLYEKAMFRFNK